jgi:hypothetical protein
MEAVFPISALYFGPPALMFYWRWARAPGSPAPGAHAMHDDGGHAGAPRRQIGMIAGFATSWPANVWRLRRGIKVAM